MRLTFVGSVVLCVLASLLFAASASAQQTRQVTIAARSCPAFTDITANRARNNIQESLEDLGVDTPYGQNGRPLLVDAATEAEFQPNCTADRQLAVHARHRDLDPRRGTAGAVGPAELRDRPVQPPTIVTQNRIPLLDGTGQDTRATIDGATTIRLTDEQIRLASQGSKLWIQGGTPDQPITDAVTYGFGALRCATDNLNGDNVEWISYPTGATHVFCFAYYVKPAPTSGTITVRKKVTLPSGTPAQTLRFTGNVSYENNQFSLTSSNTKTDSISFIRAAGTSWNFTEEIPPLAKLDSITCTSTKGSTITKDVASGRTDVLLAKGDDVVCTYKNSFRRPPSGLTLRKISAGGTGIFGFKIEGEGSLIDGASAETTQPNLSTLVTPTDKIADLSPGTYTVTETTPGDDGGTWSLDSVTLHAEQREGGARRRQGPDHRGRERHGLHLQQPLHARRAHHAAQDHARRHRDDALPGPPGVRRRAPGARAGRHHDRGGRGGHGDGRGPR